MGQCNPTSSEEQVWHVLNRGNRRRTNVFHKREESAAFVSLIEEAKQYYPIKALTDDPDCYHFNTIGSTFAMTNSAQTVVNKYAYDPFGNNVAEDVQFDQPFKFAGQVGIMTESNGFYYMRARYYDPQVGRFISEDPIGFDGGDLNLYAYVGNGPVVGIDPSGQFIVTGTTAAYLFVIAPAVSRYGPVIARAARNGYARLAPAASRAGQAVMNFARSHPEIVQGLNDAIPSSLPSTSPAPTPGGALGFAIGEAYRNRSQQQPSASTPNQQQGGSLTPSYTGSGGK